MALKFFNSVPKTAINDKGVATANNLREEAGVTSVLNIHGRDHEGTTKRPTERASLDDWTPVVKVGDKPKTPDDFRREREARNNA